MRSYFCLLLFFVFGHQSVQSQEMTYFLGLLGGINKGDLQFSEDFSDEYAKLPEIVELNGQITDQWRYLSNSKLNSFQVGLRAGLNISDKLAIVVDPLFSRQNISLTTDGAFEYVKRNSTIGEVIKSPEQKTRIWKFTMNSLYVPVYASYKIIGDKNTRFSISLDAGLSIRKSFSGSDVTSIYGDKDNSIYVQNTQDPFRRYFIDPPAYGWVPYTNQWPRNNENLQFGKSKIDHLNDVSLNLTAGLSMRYSLNEEQSAFLCFNMSYNKGLTKMYTSERIDFLQSTNTAQTFNYRDIFTNLDVPLNPQSAVINGNMVLSTLLLSLGVEYCPKCVW